MILVIVEMTTTAGTREAMIAQLHALLGDGAPGLVQYAIGTRKEEPRVVLVSEEWEDAASLDAFMSGDAVSRFSSETRASFEYAPTSRRFDIDVPNKTTISLL